MSARYPYDFNNDFNNLAIAVRMPYDHPKCLRLSLFLSQNYKEKNNKIAVTAPRIITGFLYGARTMLPTTCLRATVLRFLKNCKSADYYKIVEATEIVGSRRIVTSPLRRPHEIAEIGILRSSQANRRPNVT